MCGKTGREERGRRQEDCSTDFSMGVLGRGAYSSLNAGFGRAQGNAVSVWQWLSEQEEQRRALSERETEDNCARRSILQNWASDEVGQRALLSETEGGRK